MSRHGTEEIAAAAAQLVVEEGLEYAAAKRKAARRLAGAGRRSTVLPRNEEVEDAVREYLALFRADSQPAELASLRHVARHWMERLAAHRPHLCGAVWRGTATLRSAVLLDLYCDDPKAAEIDLINLGVSYDAAGDGSSGQDSVAVLSLADRAPGLPEPVTVHLLVHDLDDLRGALKPDARGRTWRGDLAALQQLIAAEADTRAPTRADPDSSTGRGGQLRHAEPRE